MVKIRRRGIIKRILKDGGFYREQPKLINADWEEHADARTRPNYRD